MNRFLNPDCKALASVLLGVILLGVTPAWAWTVTEEAVQLAVVSHVQKQLEPMLDRSADEEVNIEVIKVPGAPFSFPEAESLEDIQIQTESALGEMYSNRAVVRVRVIAPTGRERSVGVPVKISIQKPVWVLKESIDAHQPLNSRFLELQVRQVSRDFSHVVGKETDLSQYVARVNLRRGDVLDSRKLVIPPDVARNSRVRIILTTDSGMHISVHGTAVDEGRIGETIRVRQELFGVRKYYSARIVDKNKVLVEI